MFTVKPVSNSRQEILIEAVQGLGETLVSGQVRGDRYVVGQRWGRN
ncbi:MAG: Pyruvate phosphate dikinase, AMP/ATP-binding domain [Eubacteriales bacterium]|nr:Pyruvate phosphate dikinase, AMP/ATP-binding domain [Eubacteriales bacterium]MDN5362968.1 Pyruvate phosphate dikinase, AMP/ATP-binding domain [Eubacteriales bacterium]